MNVNNIINKNNKNVIKEDDRTTKYIYPNNIEWISNNRQVKNVDSLLQSKNIQVDINEKEFCSLKNDENTAGLLIDFGIEINGGIQISVLGCGKNQKTVQLRIRFGESAMETMSELGGEKNATNDHAIRDTEILVSQNGTHEIGNTGFRFVRIDLLKDYDYVEIKSVRGVLRIRDLEYRGEFHSSDKLLNDIWQTGAYTVHLNMQEMLWDGIKRDRLVWVGDMYPEIKTIFSVFGHHDIINKSLDFVREKTPLSGWMNNISTYSMWWIIIQYELYFYTGDIKYLQKQSDYIINLLARLREYTEPEKLKNIKFLFLDWPTSDDQSATRAGVFAILKLALEYGAKICKVLGKSKEQKKCIKNAQKMVGNCFDPGINKPAASLMVLAELLNPIKANKNILSVNGIKGISTYTSYYYLKARLKGNDVLGSLDAIRNYYGAMLESGATTFWEHFDIEWLEEDSTIEKVVENPKRDIHGRNGDYCYKGYRHSLCHGWAAGPTPFLSEYVLGIKILESGFKKIKINPVLGDLKWVRGKYPTPFGDIVVRHKKNSSGDVISDIKKPEEVELIEK